MQGDLLCVSDAGGRAAPVRQRDLRLRRARPDGLHELRRDLQACGDRGAALGAGWRAGVRAAAGEARADDDAAGAHHTSGASTLSGGMAAQGQASDVQPGAVASAHVDGVGGAARRRLRLGQDDGARQEDLAAVGGERTARGGAHRGAHLARLRGHDLPHALPAGDRDVRARARDPHDEDPGRRGRAVPGLVGRQRRADLPARGAQPGSDRRPRCGMGRWRRDPALAQAQLRGVPVARARAVQDVAARLLLDACGRVDVRRVQHGPAQPRAHQGAHQGERPTTWRRTTPTSWC